MFLTRILSALILAPIVVGLIWIGGWPFSVLLVAFLSLAAIEFAQVMRRGGFEPPIFFTLILIIISTADAFFPDVQLLRPAIAFVLISSLTWQLFNRTGTPTINWALALIGGLYLGIAGAHFILLRQLSSGERWLLLSLTGTWLADSGAYLVGSRIGRHKMTPTLSPKKSWEGLIGGIVISVLINMIVAALLDLPIIHGAALGLIGASIGLLGDLSISMIKRQVGVKDTGQLIPGHGGALDRLDSVLFTVIVSYYYIIWIALVPALP
ncbi:MAG TPA: phosphatidate cytidylyltransferase [Anaerolineae bacterium]|nr:phosphatidate cytidylyltransferase [Anaerolineae bacterium]